MEGIRSILPPDRVDLRIFLTDNKFANERRCLQVSRLTESFRVRTVSDGIFVLLENLFSSTSLPTNAAASRRWSTRAFKGSSWTA